MYQFFQSVGEGLAEIDLLAVLPWLIVAVLWVECGRRTLQVIYLSLPAGSKEPMAEMVRTNAVPIYVMTVWIIVWPLLVLAGRICAMHRSWSYKQGAEEHFTDLR